MSPKTTLPVTTCPAAGGGLHQRVTGPARRRRRPPRPAATDPVDDRVIDCPPPSDGDGGDGVDPDGAAAGAVSGPIRTLPPTPPHHGQRSQLLPDVVPHDDGHE